MSDEQSLRQAVLDDPDADQPRLAYADWCATQADPVTQRRAELIRAQLQLAAIPDEVVNAGGATRLIETIAAMLARDGAAWAAPVAPFVRSFAFLGGFVEHVGISARALLDHGAELFAHAPIRHVDLLGVREVDETLFASPLFASLRTLGLDRLGLYDIHLQLLAVSPHVGALRWLSAIDNNFGIDAYVALASSRSLTQLVFAEFRGNPVDPIEQLGRDGAEVVSAFMPDAGQALEQRFGHLEWLHRDEKPSARYDY
jgi:uncharacterized protein (TIGR02996 family)